MTPNPTHVRTGSRLHLGLLSLPGEGGTAARTFGGVGLMIDEPAVHVSVVRADAWHAEGPSAGRALAIAREAAGPNAPALDIRVESCPAEHVGLGTGTQLAMAVGTAVRTHLGMSTDPLALAADLGRGLRSGLGVHGFVHGGFLVDGGKGAATVVAPLVCRHEFPGEWGILLVTPRRDQGLAGAGERAAFAALARQPADEHQTDSLCRLALLGMLPAMIERDLPAFGEAVFEFNRRAGLLFKASQGGEYSSPAAAELVAMLRGMGFRGVGQSSWGPTVFAIGDRDQIGAAAICILGDLDVRITTARNCGWARSLAAAEQPGY